MPSLLRFVYEIRALPATSRPWFLLVRMGIWGYRKLHSRCGACKQDVLLADDNGREDSPLVNVGAFESRVAYRTAKKKLKGEPERDLKGELERRGIA